MEASTGATAVMAETRAGDYYRRSGFSGIAIRDRPGVRYRKNFVQVREWELDEGRIYELIVYPELTVREKPWRFWGKVEAFGKVFVAFTLMTEPNKGMPITVPYRYFQDGRVWMFQIGQE